MNRFSGISHCLPVLGVGSALVTVPVAVVHWDDMQALAVDAADMDENSFLGRVVAILMRMLVLSGDKLAVAADGALECTLSAAAMHYLEAAGEAAVAAAEVVAAGRIWNVHS